MYVGVCVCVNETIYERDGGIAVGFSISSGSRGDEMRNELRSHYDPCDLSVRLSVISTTAARAVMLRGYILIVTFLRKMRARARNPLARTPSHLNSTRFRREEITIDDGSVEEGGGEWDFSVLQVSLYKRISSGIEIIRPPLLPPPVLLLLLRKSR